MGMTRGHGTAAVVIGTLQLLVAGALVIASFVFASYGSMSTSQTPYWGGFPFLITGAFGVAAGISKNQCCMVTFLVLSIIMTIVTAGAAIVVTIALTFWSAVVDTTNCVGGDGTCICYNKYLESTETYNVDNCDVLKNVLAAFWVILVCCYASAILAFAGSILGCAATCCAPPDPPMVMIAQQPMGAPGVVVSHSSMQVAGGAYAPGAQLPAYTPGAYGPAYPQGVHGQAMYAEQTVASHDKAPLVV